MSPLAVLALFGSVMIGVILLQCSETFAPFIGRIFFGTTKRGLITLGVICSSLVIAWVYSHQLVGNGTEFVSSILLSAASCFGVTIFAILFLDPDLRKKALKLVAGSIYRAGLTLTIVMVLIGLLWTSFGGPQLR